LGRWPGVAYGRMRNGCAGSGELAARPANFEDRQRNGRRTG